MTARAPLRRFESVTVIEKIEKPCARGCGRTARMNRLSMNEGRSWDFLREIALVCDQCSHAEEQEQERREVEERRLHRLAARISRSGLPQPLQAITWEMIDDDPDRSDARDAAMRWGRGELDGLTLCGDVGVGKTWMAAAALWQRLDAGAGRWYSVPKLIADSHAWGTEQERDAVTALGGDMPLVLDDIDKVKATEWVASQLFIAIDGRFQNGGAWIVTTNLDPDEFADRFGPALADRLFGGRSEVHVIHGHSKRQ